MIIPKQEIFCWNVDGERGTSANERSEERPFWRSDGWKQGSRRNRCSGHEAGPEGQPENQSDWRLGMRRWWCGG